jgi:hypothetical protein
MIKLLVIMSLTSRNARACLLSQSQSRKPHASQRQGLDHMRSFQMLLCGPITCQTLAIDEVLTPESLLVE